MFKIEREIHLQIAGSFRQTARHRPHQRHGKDAICRIVKAKQPSSNMFVRQSSEKADSRTRRRRLGEYSTCCGCKLGLGPAKPEVGKAGEQTKHRCGHCGCRSGEEAKLTDRIERNQRTIQTRGESLVTWRKGFFNS